MLEAQAAFHRYVSNTQAAFSVVCVQGDDREVVTRGMHDCWVVAKHRNGRELCVVMEGKGEVGLAGASKLALDFTDSHFPSIF